MGGAFASGARRGACMKAPARRGVNGARNFARNRSVDEERARNLARFLALLRAALIRAVGSHSSAPRERSDAPNDCELAGARPIGRSCIAVEVGAARALAATRRRARAMRCSSTRAASSAPRASCAWRSTRASSRRWLRGGQLGALESALTALTDGASALALIPVDDVSALRADPSYTFASFVASPANSAVRARAHAFARDARSGSGAALAIHGGTQLGQDSPAARASRFAGRVARRERDRVRAARSSSRSS